MRLVPLLLNAPAILHIFVPPVLMKVPSLINVLLLPRSDPSKVTSNVAPAGLWITELFRVVIWPALHVPLPGLFKVQLLSNTSPLIVTPPFAFRVPEPVRELLFQMVGPLTISTI